MNTIHIIYHEVSYYDNYDMNMTVDQCAKTHFNIVSIKLVP